MKQYLIVFLLLLLSLLPVAAQVPTNGLAAEYDMVTITGGTTLVDSSGNGNNGTLNGTTPGTTGVAFNGSSDYISIPSVVGNSNVTVIACASTNTNQGRIWFEGNTAAGAPSNSFTPRNATFNNGSTGYTTNLSIIPAYTDWHCFYYQRDGQRVTYGVPELNLQQSELVSNTTITTGSGALGAQHFTGTTNSYFAGTIGYVYIYTRILSPTEIAGVYATTRTALAARGVYMRDIVSSVFPGRIWQRQGRIFGPNTADQTLNYTTTDCVVISNPCFQLWYDTAGPVLAYAEAPPVTGVNGLVLPGAWTSYGTIVASYQQGQVTRVTGFSFKYLMLATPAAQTGSKDAFTSNDPVHFTKVKTAALPSGGAGVWDDTINNSSIYQLGSTLYVAYDGIVGGQPYLCGGATSTDGLNWTKAAANPLSGYGQQCSQPFLWNDAITGEWYMWAENAGNNSVPNIFRFQSSVFNSIWNGTSPGSIWGNAYLASFPTLTAAAPDELSQNTCAGLLELNGVSYLDYCAADASNIFWIKLAIAPMTLHQLVKTGEGATTSNP